MLKFRPRVTVEAEQFDPQRQPWPEGVSPWLGRKEPLAPGESHGYMKVEPDKIALVFAGDWIVTGVTGLRWPVRNDAFLEGYEPAEETS